MKVVLYQIKIYHFYCYIVLCIVVLDISKNDSYQDQYSNPILLVIRKNKRSSFYMITNKSSTWIWVLIILISY